MSKPLADRGSLKAGNHLEDTFEERVGESSPPLSDLAFPKDPSILREVVGNLREALERSLREQGRLIVSHVKNKAEVKNKWEIGREKRIQRKESEAFFKRNIYELIILENVLSKIKLEYKGSLDVVRSNNSMVFQIEIFRNAYKSVLETCRQAIREAEEEKTL